MNRGAPSLSITVVPDSGTGEFAGLPGKMNPLIAADGAQYYPFEYGLPEKSGRRLLPLIHPNGTNPNPRDLRQLVSD